MDPLSTVAFYVSATAVVFALASHLHYLWARRHGPRRSPTQ
jgi:hypothetical protein